MRNVILRISMVFFFKQKTAYEMRISDWSSDVCSSDLRAVMPLINLLRRPGDILVGDNEPYDGALRGDTMYRHCMTTGTPPALLEVRQDLIAAEAGIEAWAVRLAPIFAGSSDRGRVGTECGKLFRLR